MRNHGNTCYFNSIWQVLAHSRRFVQEVSTFGTPAPSSQEATLLKETRNLVFRHWLRKATPMSSRRLLSAMKSFRPDIFTIGEQQDGQEAILAIISALKQSVNVVQSPATLTLFTFQTSTTTECAGMPRPTPKLSEHVSLDVAIPRSSKSVDLEGLILKSFKEEYIPSFRCVEGQPATGATQQVVLTTTPDILIVSLKRGYYSISRKAMFKVHTAVTFSSELRLGPGNSIFKLVGVIYHIGNSVTGGHYVAQFHNRKLGAWFHADDTHVSPITAPANSSSRAYLFLYERLTNI